MRFSIKKYKKYFRFDKKTKLILSLIACVFLLLLCYEYASSRGVNSKYDYYVSNFSLEDVNEKDYPYHFIDKYDLDTDDSNAYYINFNDYEEDIYKILEGGTYRLTGTLNGQLYIKAKDEIVHLIFDNVDIESYDGPAILVDNAKKIVITLAEETNNKVSDSGRYKENAEYDSAIMCLANLTINGEGSLDVYGLYKDAIRTRDTFKFISGDLSIHSKRTGIHATDGINIIGGEILVASEKYGFKTTKNGLNNRGSLMLLGGEINIIAGRSSFVAQSSSYIFNCTIHENSTYRYDVNGFTYEDGDCFK